MMSNMSYCAFENTANDLRQCLSMMYEAREEGKNLREFIESRSSKHESRAVEVFLSVAEEIIELSRMMDVMEEDE